ncbi:universal stress protein [Jannaschia sp. R86511]|uniref:universal stress protein n=1 Tax=Jannaschia sp. R86511 TaxID=3093853 RepID=UPI0036D2BFB0
MVVSRDRTKGPVVVGVDGSPEAARAVGWALSYARDAGLGLHLVHAYGGGGAAALRQELAAQGAAAGHAAVARRTLDEALADARAQAGPAGSTGPAADGEAGTAEGSGHEVPVDGALHLGSAAGALREASRTAALVVVGSRGHGGLTGLLLGSVAVPVSAHAACPVVVVRGTEPLTAAAAAPVVVGVDGSGESTQAVGFALAEAQRHGCPLHVVMAWDELWIGAPELQAPIPTAAELQEDAVRMVSETLAGWSDVYPDVRVTRVVERGRAAPVLLREAVGARLVVVGSRGRGGFGGLLLGSTSQTLLHRSPVDVAVVRRS